MEPPRVRKIVHVDMDAFYASVEQRDRPELRGQPVVVAWKGARSVVCAASYEARRFGIRSAMPAVRAERLCPHAVFVPPDFNRYRTVAREVRAVFLKHTPLVEPLSLDEAYLDVTTTLSGLPSATAVAEAIRQEIRDTLQLTASAGVAPNKFLAKIASDVNKPDGLCVVRPRDVDCFLLPLPVARLPGVGKVMNEKLAALGVTTVAELRGLSAPALEQRFGRWGRRLHELSLGIDEHPVQPDRPRRSVSAEDTFADDLPREALMPHIRQMAERAWAAAQKAGYEGRTVVLKLKTADFRILSRTQTGATPPASAAELAERALRLLERVDLPRETRFRLVGVGMDKPVSPQDFLAAGQGGLFGE